MAKNPNLQVISSKFTRRNGYMDIQSSEKINYDKAINILNSFTPQGASPQYSVRIGTWNGKIGIGCYYMLDAENAKLSTVLIDTDINSIDKILNIPNNDDLIVEMVEGGHLQLFISPSFENNFLNDFDSSTCSMILYSFLAGDNMIIIHPDHKIRLQFIKSLLSFVPFTFYHYNRITSGCSELDGNENIIGVEQLPKKYRSHKKLYMPVDTIFVDLMENKVMGEGLKSNQFTKEIIENYKIDTDLGRKSVINYFEEISKEQYTENGKYGENSKQLTSKIRTKLGLKVKSDEDWLLSF